MASTRAALASVSQEISVSTSPFREINPAIAAGNGLYLVVWAELIPVNSTTANPDIWAVRVRASDGVVLDSLPIRIAEGAAAQFNPAVASDGSNFLVVWNHLDSGAPKTYGTRVRASDGAVLDTPHLISTFDSAMFSGLPHYNASVAFDGTNYLVVWEGVDVQGSGENTTSFTGVFGTWVKASDGQLLNPYGFVISQSTSSPPQVAYGNGRYLVTWAASSGQSSDIFAARIDAASRSRIDVTPLRLTNSPEGESSPAVASAGSQFLVVWGSGGHTRAARVGGSTGALIDGAGFDLGEGSLTPASATFDGRDYRVSWQGTRGGERKLLSARISPTNGMAAGSEIELSSISTPSESTAPGIAATEQGHFLVAYARAERIKVRTVEDVQAEGCDALAPTIVLNGPAEMTLECGPGTYSDLGAQAFDGCGNPLQVYAYNTGNDSSGTGPILSAEGSYVVSYEAWDANGRRAIASRTVLVDDRTAPTLTLNGAASMTHTCGSEWVDPGVTVSADACYGAQFNSVWSTGYVNGWAEGVFTVSYQAADGGGNYATPVTRTVEVVNCPW